METRPKTAGEVMKYVEDTYLLRLLENEYQTQKDMGFQLEYAMTKEGQNMYGKEVVETKRPLLEVEVERSKGRVKFILSKLAMQTSGVK